MNLMRYLKRPVDRIDYRKNVQGKVTYEVKNCEITQNKNRNDYLKSLGGRTSTDGNQTYEIDVLNDDKNLEEATVNSQVQDLTLVNESVVVGSENINEIPIILTNNNFKILVDHILEMKSMLWLILNKFNLEEEHRLHTKDNILDDRKIQKLIPVDSIGQLLELEDILKNDAEVSNQLFNKVLLTGGRDFKDIIKRSLGVIFTNNVASLCSWIGQKNNFKLSDTAVIKLVKGAVRKISPQMTDKEFETTVMNWLDLQDKEWTRNDVFERYMDTTGMIS